MPKKPARMKPCGTAYFGVLLNLTTGRQSYSAPIGLRELKEADDRMPFCPDSAQKGDIILRRMTRNAPDELTHPVPAMDEGGEVSFICMDLPVSDHYYVV